MLGYEHVEAGRDLAARMRARWGDAAEGQIPAFRARARDLGDLFHMEVVRTAEKYLALSSPDAPRPTRM